MERIGIVRGLIFVYGQTDFNVVAITGHLLECGDTNEKEVRVITMLVVTLATVISVGFGILRCDIVGGGGGTEQTQPTPDGLDCLGHAQFRCCGSQTHGGGGDIGQTQPTPPF